MKSLHLFIINAGTMIAYLRLDSLSPLSAFLGRNGDLDGGVIQTTELVIHQFTHTEEHRCSQAAVVLNSSGPIQKYSGERYLTNHNICNAIEDLPFDSIPFDSHNRSCRCSCRRNTTPKGYLELEENTGRLKTSQRIIRVCIRLKHLRHNYNLMPG